MHQRRPSSLAHISGTHRDPLRSHGLASLSDELVVGSASTSSSSRMHQRIRILLLLFAVSIVALFGLTRAYIGSYPHRLRPTARNLVAHRAYPPLTHLYHGPPESRPPSSQAPSTPSITLTLTEELGAVIAYLTSLGANAMIPSTVDPSRPIDPELVLEFNTRSERARAEVAELVSETWAQSPVVLFTESRSPASKSVKELLNSYALLPRPVIFDVDQRTDEAVLTPLVFRLTSSKSLPIVIVGGKLLAVKDLVALDASGDLTDWLEASGAIVDALPSKFRKQAT